MILVYKSVKLAINKNTDSRWKGKSKRVRVEMNSVLQITIWGGHPKFQDEEREKGKDVNEKE